MPADLELTPDAGGEPVRQNGQGKFPILCVKPLSKNSTRARSQDIVLRNVAKHNLREISSDADPFRRGLNVILRGPDTAAGVAGLGQQLLHDAGITRPRKDAVLGIELVTSLPPKSTIDPVLYFKACVEWAEQWFSAPILSAVIHNDQTNAHAHIVILALRDGKLCGSKILGKKAEFRKMHESFQKQVAAPFGLQAGSPQKRLGAAERARLAVDVIATLKNSPELMAKAEVANELAAAISVDPTVLAGLLGLNAARPHPAPRAKTFAGIMTGNTKPESPIRTFGEVLLGRSSETPVGKSNVLSCVRTFADSTSQSPQHPSHAHLGSGGFTQ